MHCMNTVPLRKFRIIKWEENREFSIVPLTGDFYNKAIVSIFAIDEDVYDPATSTGEGLDYFQFRLDLGKRQKLNKSEGHTSEASQALFSRHLLYLGPIHSCFNHRSV